MSDKMPDEIWAAPLLYPNDIGNEWSKKHSLGTIPYVRADLVIRKDDDMLDRVEEALSVARDNSDDTNERAYYHEVLTELQKLRGHRDE